ncbi:hypothetical protein AGR2A_Cc100047 [Agrobacterium genomosp. 2 str. CFBP 5494]|uniref:Uncharacterized protein n=1 Tax=Agrobacterium genomosp. 2 str. CFBP 5494 TaxID=1183436 RepID=A0A9W5EWV8_9HYPH|nr:hypothetical protein AGR2A_Cc100047 [Agrobacterium genomosp. 2 str. CFBP 5494]
MFSAIPCYAGSAIEIFCLRCTHRRCGRHAGNEPASETSASGKRLTGNDSKSDSPALVDCVRRWLLFDRVIAGHGVSDDRDEDGGREDGENEAHCRLPSAGRQPNKVETRKFTHLRYLRMICRLIS